MQNHNSCVIKLYLYGKYLIFIMKCGIITKLINQNLPKSIRQRLPIAFVT